MSSSTTADAATGIRPWQVANVMAYAGMVIVNGLANSLPINGVTSGQVSDRFPTFVTPAGYVFGIWGVIYALLAVFVVYQALPSRRDDERLRRLGYMFVVSCVCNAAWLFAWHNLRIALAWALIVALLVSLVVCYGRLRGESVNRFDRLAVRLPFSVYLGWVTVATVANTSILGVYLGVDGGALAPWLGALAIAAAAAIGLALLAVHGDIAFVLVLVWAFVGIAVAQASRSAVIIAAAAAACAVLLAGVGWRAVRGTAARA